jgi:hypothetical protein
MRSLVGLVGLAAAAAVALAPTATASGPRAEVFFTGVTGTGEPNIGVAPDGTVYATAMAKTVRSLDGGRHFTDVTPPGHVATLDPFLYVDKVTGRVYKSDLSGTCQLLSWSDDRGATWTSSAAACNLSDHQSITSAPPVSSPTVGYPHVLYNCSQTVGYNGYSAASGCDKSLDGGTTWVPTGTYAFSDPGSPQGDSGVPYHCLGDVGAIHAAPDGTLYVPRGWCGQPWLAVSHDEGLTWTRTQVATNGMNTTLSGGFGVVAPGSGQSDYQATAMADGKGNVAFFWIALDRLPYLAFSHDHGATFGKPVMVAPKGVKEAWGPAIDMDAKGRLALAYLASTNSPGKPWTGSYKDTDFTGYLGLVTGMNLPKPSITSARLPGDALVRGACSPGRCNDGTLDFIDVAFAKDGAVLGAFVDTRTSRHELVVGRLR